MKKLFILVFLFLYQTSQAQTPKIHFEYDAAGNQILREYCSGCESKQFNQNIKDIKDIKDDDLIKFFPEDVISYYPNPVRDELFIKWELVNENKISNIEMYSISGQLIKTYKDLLNQQSLNVPFQDLPEGIYFVNLNYTNGDQKSIKIIKK